MRRWFLAIWLCLAALPALAQDLATLVADSITLAPDNRIVASGNVEVMYGTIRVEAQSVIYDQRADHVTIEGPITLIDGESQVILADAAELDGDLRNGILRGARLVLERQLQLAAAEINRVDGRYTQLYKTVASSCQVCGRSSVPLWRIRATRVTHDEVERQLYFRNARFEVVGVPIFWVPRMRLPDPTLTRATGFLIPQIKVNSLLGTGVKVPYFFTLGDHADLTLTGYVSRETRTVEARYRRAFTFGDLVLQGAASDDDLTSLRNRWFLFGRGDFDLPRGFAMTATLELVSDPAYLLDYDYSEQDRLRSGIEIERTRADEYIGTRVTHFRTLRDREIPIADQLPSVVGDVLYERRYTERWLGGAGSLRLEAHGHYRDSSVDALGRDVGRLSARADWRRSLVFGPGIVATALGAINADLYGIAQDPAFDSTVAHLTPIAGAELRWPLVRRERSGAVQTLEPVVQVLWSEDTGADVPNEDSTFTEFDEGNLFSLNRFPGSDAYERGLRTNIGLSWTRTAANGNRVGLTFGRIIRGKDLAQFAPGSGLNGASSDWLASVQYESRGFAVRNRALFDDNFDFTKNEMRLQWTGDRFGIATTYFWSNGAAPLLPDGTVGLRPARSSELTMDARYRLTDTWTSSFDWRYDFEADSSARAGVGLSYENECVAIDLSVSRRFTSSTNVQPSTDFNLSVRLTGFGTGSGGQAPRRSCG